MNRLAILIPTIGSRTLLYERLVNQLQSQINGDNRVMIITNSDNGEKTTGQKRNELVATAMSLNIDYCCFFDDDDYPSRDYVRKQLEVVDSGKDCGSLWGQIYFNNKPGMPFHHSIEHKDLYQDYTRYYRPINHLNTCKTAIRAAHPFPDQSWGEDSVQALTMVGAFESQHEVEGIVYHYFCGKEKGGELEAELIKSLYS